MQPTPTEPTKSPITNCHGLASIAQAHTHTHLTCVCTPYLHNRSPDLGFIATTYHIDDFAAEPPAQKGEGKWKETNPTPSISQRPVQPSYLSSRAEVTDCCAATFEDSNSILYEDNVPTTRDRFKLCTQTRSVGRSKMPFYGNGARPF